MNILLLTHRLPYAPNRGDRIRSYHLLRHLGEHHDVHLVSFVHDAAEAREVDTLRPLVASLSVAPVSRMRNALRALWHPGVPLTHVLLDSPEMTRILSETVARHPPDLVLAYCSGMARFALMPPLREVPFILDMVDVDSQKWATLGSGSSGLRRWIYQREGRLMSAFEAEAANRSRATTVINAREQTSLLRIAPSANVRVVSNGIDATGFRPPSPAAQGARVVFVGVLDYRPNEEGVLWMVEHVWPAVRARRPDARLMLVGANPTAAIRELPSRDSSIEVTGSVPDVRPYLWDGAVAVVPLATARGLQNKALEAIAAGLPVVVTPVVREGLPALVDPACIVAKDSGDFAEAILSLLALRPDERRVMAERVDLSSLSWPAQLTPFVELIAATHASRAVMNGTGVTCATT